MSSDDKLRKLLSDENQIKHCCGQLGTRDIEGDIKLIKQALWGDSKLMTGKSGMSGL
jgi:hypothetical protein